jgi:hypothetical protein
MDQDPYKQSTDPDPVPEFIDPVFTKTSPKRSFSVTQNERFGLVFAKTGFIISGTEGPISRQNITGKITKVELVILPRSSPV